jgi:hypothetical protein
LTVIGTVDLRAFDAGVVALLGPELVSFAVDGATRQAYAVQVAGVDSGLAVYGGRVPVHFTNPEDVFQAAIVPCFRVARLDLTPAFDRQSWYCQVARGPAPGAVEVILPSGQRGWSRYETQWRAEPYDITYDVSVLGRRREDAQRMLAHALGRCKGPWWAVPVVDSLGDTRHYDAGDLGVSEASALVDIADRVIGWTMSFTVRAEIDLTDTTTATAFTGASALDPHDPLYSRHDLILRTHMGVDPAEW